MDELRNQHNDGRTAMIAAFGELTTLALRAGMDEGVVTALHGQFFNGNVDVKCAWRVALLLAEIYCVRN
jgi:hypothetical protein